MEMSWGSGGGLYRVPSRLSLQLLLLAPQKIHPEVQQRWKSQWGKGHEAGTVPVAASRAQSSCPVEFNFAS